MKIRIENIGPVKTVDIDLSKPLIIFTGLNGSGKTYVSYVLYTICRLFVYEKDFLGWEDFVKSKQKKRKGVLDVDQLYSLLKAHLKIMNSILNVAFGVKFNDDLVKDAKLTLLTTKEEFREEIMSVDDSIQAEDVFSYIKKKNSLKYTITNKGGGLEDTILINYVVIKDLLFNTILEDFEPSDRSGLSTFNNEIVLGLEKYQENNVDSVRKGKYKQPMAISRFLDDLKDNLKQSPEESKYRDLADEIEKELMHGYLTVSDSDDVYYKKEGMDNEIPLSLSSSGVKTMCSIILFLRNSAMDSNLIIIDEPEINLHPKYQVMFARILSKIVNAGIRLIINTHSDYIIREINNMIMLSSINDDKKIKRLGYSKKEVLKADDVSPYYFETQKKRKEVKGKEIEVTKTGFSIDLIDDVINEQVETSQKIYEALEN